MGRNSVYYKIYLNSDNKYCVVTMQWFDEFDYNENKFLKKSNGEHYQFTKEKDAKLFLNKIVKPEFIHEKDLILEAKDMFKLPKNRWDK